MLSIVPDLDSVIMSALGLRPSEVCHPLIQVGFKEEMINMWLEVGSRKASRGCEWHFVDCFRQMLVWRFFFFFLSFSPSVSSAWFPDKRKSAFKDTFWSRCFKLQAVALCSPLYLLLYGQIGETRLLKRGSCLILINFFLLCRRERFSASVTRGHLTSANQSSFCSFCTPARASNRVTECSTNVTQSFHVDGIVKCVQNWISSRCSV